MLGINSKFVGLRDVVKGEIEKVENKAINIPSDLVGCPTPFIVTCVDTSVASPNALLLADFFRVA